MKRFFAIASISLLILTITFLIIANRYVTNLHPPSDENVEYSDLAVDENGTVHMIIVIRYGETGSQRNDDVFYQAIDQKGMKINERILLRSNRKNSQDYSSFPKILYMNNSLLIFWNYHSNEGERIEYLISIDHGTTWSRPITILPEGYLPRIYDISTNGTDVFMTFTHENPQPLLEKGEVYFLCSRGGLRNWSDPILLSNHDSYSSFGPRISVRGEMIIVTWNDGIESDRYTYGTGIIHRIIIIPS